MKILFYPHKPFFSRFTLRKIISKLDYKITSDFNNFDIGIYWNYFTYKTKNKKTLKKINKYKLLNRNVKSIDKKTVDKVFGKVFGYKSLINPRKYNGIAVKKSNLNAIHYGRLVDCPRKPSRFFIYQKLIDTTEKNLVKDMRVPIIGDEMPIVLFKYRPANIRFKNVNTKAKVNLTSEVFNQKEIDQIKEFTKSFGLDYGELDILRDKDRKIYIIDVNITPWFAKTGITKKDSDFALKLLSASFEKLILQRS